MVKTDRKKKNRLFILILITSFMMLISCTTSVDISYMKSANVNMGQYRKIALASAVPYGRSYMDSSVYMRPYDRESSRFPVLSSYSGSLASKVASYAADAAFAALSSNGYFSIMPPAETDAVIALGRMGINSSAKFREAGIDAVVIPAVEEMKVDEYSRVYIDSYKETADPRTGVKTKIPHYTYAYYQKVAVTLSLTVVDTKTERIIAKRVYTKEEPSYREYKYTPSDVFGFVYSRVNDPYSSFKSLLDSCKKTIISDFIPTRRYASLELMGNKPKIKSLESAYEAAEDGNLTFAYNAFMAEWSASGHIPSAYNAAVIKAAGGDIAGAIDFLNAVRLNVASSEINALYNKMVAYKNEDDKAKAQLSGSAPASYESSSSSYSIYTALGK